MIAGSKPSSRFLGLFALLLSVGGIGSCKGGVLFLSPSGTALVACTTVADCAVEQACVSGYCYSEQALCSAVVPKGTCPAELECHSGVCVAGHVDWCENCSSDLTCYAGACVPLDVVHQCSPVLPAGACAGSDVCVGGVCTPLNDTNQCSPNHPKGMCPAGSTCNDGFCQIPSTPQCSLNAPDGWCPAGQSCYGQGVCLVDACTPQTPYGACDVNQWCLRGHCEVVPCSPTHLVGTCSADDQKCSSHGTCVANNACFSAIDCLELQNCSHQGLCIYEQCLDDIDCSLEPQSTCVNNSCERDYSCESENDCVSGQEYCSAAHTCIPLEECRLDIDCGSGKTCYNAQSCIVAGSCVTDDYCPANQYCSHTLQCINDDSCRVDEDCAPNEACQNQRCEVTPDNTCTSNAAVPAECDIGERCGAHHGCIPDNRCINDSDCLTSHYTCGADYFCHPLQTCGGDEDCTSGDSCSFTGGCMPDSACVTDADCPGGEVCNALFQCEVGGNCGGTEFNTTLIKPNMLIVFDRSGSMNFCDHQGTVTRWNSALAAVDNVLASEGNRIRFGLTTFPEVCRSPAVPQHCSGECNPGLCPGWCRYPGIGDQSNCAPGVVEVAVGDNTAMAVSESLHANYPGGSTPTGAVMKQILANIHDYGLPELGDNVARANYVLLVTDGEASTPDYCPANGADPLATVNTALDGLLALSPSVKTFVVGFNFNGSSGSLNCHAVHGGTSRCPGLTVNNCATSPQECYYRADNTDALTAALAQILGQVASCDYRLDRAPPDQNRLFVYMQPNGDGGAPRVRIERDPTHVNGWDFNPGNLTVTFYGSYCTEVKAASVTPIVLYGCPGVDG